MIGNFLNFFECEFNSSEFEVLKLAYVDKESYDKMQMENPKSIFQRVNGNEILVYTGKNEFVYDLKYETIKINIFDYPNFTKKLILSLINGELNKDELQKVLYIKRKDYSNSIEIVSQKNLLSGKIDGIKINNKVVCTPFFSKKYSKFGFTLFHELQYSFTWDRTKFRQMGIDDRDLKGKDEVIFANKKSIKRFLESTGQLEQYNSLKESITNHNYTFKILMTIFDIIKKRLTILSVNGEFNIKNIYSRCIPYEKDIFNLEKISTPTRYYYSEAYGGSGRYEELLKKFKPCTYEKFMNKRIKCAVIVPSQYEGTTEQFITKLQKRINEIFYVDIDFEFICIKGSSLENYEESIYNNIRKFSEKTYQIAIVVLELNHKLLDIIDSPYYYCKAKLIGQSIPTQEILIENIKNNNDFILNNIALNIYAKIGGIPWVIEKIETTRQEVIIGLSSCYDKESKKIFGISQVFDYNGNYVVTNCSPLTSVKDYQLVFERFLIDSLTKIIDNRIDKSREFRLIFHLNKTPSNKHEIMAINNVMKKFNDLNFKYALVHLNNGHGFRLYNNCGRNFLWRGNYLVLDNNVSLLNLSSKGVRPLLLSIDLRSTFVDIDYITKQVYWFSHLSSKSFIPSSTPVTMQYPYLVTKLTNELKYIEGWDYKVLEGMSDKLWFI